MLLEKDLQLNWHPCSQMKDYETLQPLLIKKCRGSYIYLDNNKKIIDAISSWWCKSLGHAHPLLKKAIREQINKFEHTIFANTTHENIVLLSEQLTNLTTHLKKVFYAGDGSCAVEIALKMSLHSRLLQGEPQRNKFIALQNGYHGETLGALSVSDVGLYKQPYTSLLFPCNFISDIPYVNSADEVLWQDCETYWPRIENYLNQHAAELTAIIVEPILQGAGGMKIYSQDFLKRLRAWSKKNNIHIIADEIMTGMGRTGKMLACEHANIDADFLCLGKGLTSGWLPFSAVLTTNSIYDLFYADYAQGKTFFHSHTYSGNPLGAALALQVLPLIKNSLPQINELGNYMFKQMLEVAATTNKLTHVRHIGALVAADLQDAPANQRLGYAVFKKAIEFGALLRPLGNTIYWLPPLNTSLATINKLKNITIKSVLAIQYRRIFFTFLKEF